MKRSAALLSMIIMLLAIIHATNVIAVESVSSVNVSAQKAEIGASSGVEKVRYFTLDSPKRLVVDLYGVQPGTHNLSYDLSGGFKTLRIGPYEEKTRFVFDVYGDVFPVFNVDNTQDQVVVTWQQSKAVSSKSQVEPATLGKAQISSIDFSSEAGESSLLIGLNGQATASKPIINDNKVSFSIKDSTLPRSLRREFETLSFPSAIHSVYPYMVNIGGSPEVRFTVTLKDKVPYRLDQTTSGFVFTVEDGPYSKFVNPTTGILPISVDPVSKQTSEVESSEKTTDSVEPITPIPIIQDIEADEKKYTGEKTSLVFDDAEVRDILRLIAEISNLNIIASDEVKGAITLRLIDVPWDQALELILDITNLGMIQEGNVVRVLPKETIRNMREAELTAANAQEKLEPLVTEVVSVSYADLGNVAEPVKEILSDRGSLTEDSRNKFLIITDVSSKIERAKELISILDTPERQVMIEARIVQVNSNYSRELGVHWGFFVTEDGESTEDNRASYQAITSAGGNFLVDIAPGSVGPITPPLGFASQIQIGRAFIDEVILDLQLQALQTDGKGKVVSTPRVTTLNGEKAVISQGTTIPYQSVGEDGPKTEFVNAELKLEVTPVINPDNSIILEVLATNDSPSLTAGASAPSIDTKKAETKVLVKDGETTVLGGIFVENQTSSDEGIPGLMHIPVLGHLFKTEKKQTVKDELLIFITPTISREIE